MKDVVVIGAGLHRYGVDTEKTTTEMGIVAVWNALDDAGMSWDDIEAVYCGTGQGAWGAGHFIGREMGLTGLAITNVENASASGSAAFREAVLSVAAGAHDTAIAIGVDTTPPKAVNRPSTSPPLGPVNIFAMMARQHMEQYGTTRDQLAMVAVKSHYNASLNPYAHFQEAVTLKEVHQARMVADPLTVLHCCPWDGGGAAVIVCTPEKAREYTEKVCPRVISSVLKSTVAGGDPMGDLTEFTANIAYEQAGVGPEDMDLIEIHDAFTIEEIIYYESLGLCGKGDGGHLIEEGITALDGRHPVNSSGGLISMGHPVGPTGVGQIAEILWQMREECGKRQITRPVNTAMAHMVGAGGVCIIHLFKR